MKNLYTTAVVTVLLLTMVITGLLRAQLPPAKQAIEQQYAQERAAGSLNPAPRNPQAPLIPVPQVPFVTGIDGYCSPPFSSEDVDIVSCWNSILNGGHITVYAGANASNLQQGVVIVSTAQGTAQRFPTPVEAGAVSVVAGQNNVLLLVSATGSYSFTFDISTGAFTSTDIVPLAVVQANRLTTTASGLAYSRVSQTFNGTVTIKNVSSAAIQVPLQIVFTSLTTGVTLANATGLYDGSSFITAPAVTAIASGQSISVKVQFTNPSNAAIHFTPVIYSGSLN